MDSKRLPTPPRHPDTMSPGPPLTVASVLTVLALLPAAPAHAVGEAGAARYSIRTVLLWAGAVALVVVLVLLVSRYLARRRFLAQLAARQAYATTVLAQTDRAVQLQLGKLGRDPWPDQGSRERAAELGRAAQAVSEGLQAYRDLQGADGRVAYRQERIRRMEDAVAVAKKILSYQGPAAHVPQAHGRTAGDLDEACQDVLQLRREVQARLAELEGASDLPASVVAAAQEDLAQAGSLLDQAGQDADKGQQAARARDQVEAGCRLTQARRTLVRARQLVDGVTQARQQVVQTRALVDRRVTSLRSDIAYAERPSVTANLDPADLGQALAAAREAIDRAASTGPQEEPQDVLEDLQGAQRRLSAVLGPARESERRMARARGRLHQETARLDRELDAVFSRMSHSGRFMSARARKGAAELRDLREQVRQAACWDPVGALEIVRYASEQVPHVRACVDHDLRASRPSYWRAG